MIKKTPKKLWSGRFKESMAESVEKFTSSVHFDKRLYKQDIVQSIAYARALVKARVLSMAECKKIVRGLEEIMKGIEYGKIAIRRELEDIHMNIETILTEKVGEMGKKLHTGRSRNDQVATDLRMYVKYEVTEIILLMKKLQSALLDQADPLGIKAIFAHEAAHAGAL